MPGELKGKLIVVTGAASGIGKSVAELCAVEGGTVIAIDKNEPKLKLEGSDHIQRRCDVTDSSAIDQLSIDIHNQYNRHPDSVIHCAGAIYTVRGLEGTTEDIYEKIMNTNMKGTFVVNRKFALLMRDHKIPGSIVNISSCGVNGCSKMPAYCASKAAQVGWTKSLAKELGPYGIRCNTVHPGAIDTPIAVNSGIPTSDLEHPALRPEAPLGRLGQPIEVAQMCVFLVSDRASYMTQSCYEVTGGLIGNG